MAQLPPDIVEFTGRDEYAGRIRELLCGEAAEPGPAVRIAAIAGRPGVGKSALAVRVAHQLRPLFPGGQLHVDLRGDDGPADPAEVLGRFFRALGAGLADFPGSLDERAAVYRSVVAGRRLLVVLDNASGTDQVLPLLPGSPTCAVLVTSRRPLTDLPGARLVEVDLPGEAEAVGLLRQVVGPSRVDREPNAARHLVELCGRLPLAVRTAGARLVSKPHWNLADLLRRLADERHRLDELVHGRLDVRASLALSYRELAAPERVLFCGLAQLDVRDLTVEAAAAVLGSPPAVADRLLERLVDARLLDPKCGPAGRHLYRFHDLTRLYGRHCAHTEPD